MCKVGGEQIELGVGDGVVVKQADCWGNYYLRWQWDGMGSNRENWEGRNRKHGAREQSLVIIGLVESSAAAFCFCFCFWCCCSFSNRISLRLVLCCSVAGCLFWYKKRCPIMLSPGQARVPPADARLCAMHETSLQPPVWRTGRCKVPTFNSEKSQSADAEADGRCR